MNKQRGAIVVEATLSLSIFVFAIFTILNIVNMCFVQAKIGVSLNTAAKEIAQYSYLYYALGINNLESEFHKGTEDSRAIADETVDGIGTFMTAFSDAKEGTQNLDFDQVFGAADTAMDTADGLINTYSDAISEDPTAFIKGMAKMAVDELGQEAKKLLGQTMAKAFMKKNLKSSPNDDPDAFLRRHDVVDGMSGLDFNYTTLMAYGQSNDIQLVVTYEIRMLQLLNIDFNFKIRQCSKTLAWGNGVSIMNKDQNADNSSTNKTEAAKNLWDNKDQTQRGRDLIDAEKEKYAYTTDRNKHMGFDAYSNVLGKNEFVSIITIDTELPTYKNVSQVKSKINQTYNTMSGKVSKMGDPITMKDQKGKDVSVPSDPATRTYKVVIVIPDDADLSVVAEAISQFKANNPGVEVQISQGYGSPTREENKKT